MINLQWGTQKNGQIDRLLLVDVSGRGDYLEPTAAAQFKRMQAAIRRDVGFDLQPAPGSSAYRPASIQIDFFTERYTKVAYNTGLWWNGSYWTKKPGVAVAAIPETSNHGWARAVDLNISQLDKKAWAWMLAHAAEYGFSWATGKASGEDWHWECLTPPGTAVAGLNATPLPKPQMQEDVMSIIQVVDVKPNPVYIVAPEFIAHIPNPAALAVAKANLATFDGVHNVTTTEFNAQLDMLRIPVNQAYHFGGHPVGYSWSRESDNAAQLAAIAKKLGI
ncbi:D-alanyl-D-alanine carboxypeptidase family protein [Leifsonia sp. NPDC014704]|uniref:D-alanyl-D-alanine carboxypeptidase family protein n=1 Tax=Leifsonia sp. NPDC014704 TaxID=3364123 RepID=UPI0036F4699D